ncbi:MAG: NrfD/PsrC family molybdoenzyme membrane anchor subunit [Gemmatimonadaceae bacterium]
MIWPLLMPSGRMLLPMPNAPHWGWYIILYFFLGGLAAGLYAVGTMLHILGDPRDRRTARFCFLGAFPLVVVCGLLLIVDLGRPLRFWHMLVQSERVPMPLLKYWVPMSLGAWIVALFGLFAAGAFLGALVDSGRLTRSWATRGVQRARNLPAPVRRGWHLLGVLCAVSFAGYTGVLLVGTTVPLWQNAPLLGALFLASAASTTYALLILLQRRRDGGTQRDSHVGLHRFEVADSRAVAIELLILLVMLVLLGRSARPLVTGGYGIVFWLGVVGVGLIVPLVMHYARPQRWSVEQRSSLGAACVLAGGLLLRFVVIMAPQWPSVPPWSL